MNSAFRKGLKFFGFAFAALIALFILAAIAEMSKSSEQQAKDAAARQAKDDAKRTAQTAQTAERARQQDEKARMTKFLNHTLDLDKLEIVKQAPTKSGFGTVLLFDFAIANKADAAMKDIELTCTTQGGSGTELNKIKHTIYESIPPGKTRTFNNVNLGFMNTQTDRAGCVVTAAVKEKY